MAILAIPAILAILVILAITAILEIREILKILDVQQALPVQPYNHVNKPNATINVNSLSMTPVARRPLVYGPTKNTLFVNSAPLRQTINDQSLLLLLICAAKAHQIVAYVSTQHLPLPLLLHIHLDHQTNNKFAVVVE